ncbi:MAG: phosphoribosylformylglycinamidine synthase subunit PurQ [Coriobacteriia bacterium]|nr:phosphoribosylformylglycinamidine synthase subunit PurQ [Coriobacteriia bacterium]
MSDFRFGVIIFPGTSCGQDVVHAIRHLGFDADYVWHADSSLDGFDAVVIPSGASYGNYLRSGAIASHSPIMEAVKDYAELGKPVLGISNGFQILTEAGLLPGEMLQNKSVKYVSKSVQISVQNNSCQWLDIAPGTELTLPISHGFGSFYVDQDTLKEMEANGQIVLCYAQCDCAAADQEDASCSLDSIAAVSNRQGNVLGMMPYPERVTDGIAGTDGGAFFSAIVKHIKEVA